jgi:uracil-DNA glycosylase family 4
MIFPLDYVPPELDMTTVKQMMDDLDTDPLKNSGVRVVHPVGDGSSGVMLIGEAPGEQEDRVGEPFVGASGKFLNNILLPSVGLTRQTIYLTNIVKCRPPANRDPTDEEKLAWSPVLLAEILAVKPKIVACLGRHSLGFFVPDVKISQVHGQVQQVELFQGFTIKVLPLYHPAVALYNPNMKQVLIDDFLEVQKVMDTEQSGKNKEEKGGEELF